MHDLQSEDTHFESFHCHQSCQEEHQPNDLCFRQVLLLRPTTLCILKLGIISLGNIRYIILKLSHCNFEAKNN